MDRMFDLSGKRALVTGASGGIGEEIAKTLVAAGAKVALHGTRREKLEALAAQLGTNTVVTPASLSDADGAARLFADAEAQLGGVDILVNNAGITRDQLSMRMTDEDFQAVLDVNQRPRDYESRPTGFCAVDPCRPKARKSSDINDLTHCWTVGLLTDVPENWRAVATWWLHGGYMDRNPAWPELPERLLLTSPSPKT